MKKIEVQIPDGMKVELVNGVLTLVEEPKKYYEFKVGDKAILNRDVTFTKGLGVCLISAGTEVEITDSSNQCGRELYEIKFQNAMSVVYGCDLDPIESEPKVEYKFKVNDKVLYQGECCEVTNQCYFKEPLYTIKNNTKYHQVKETELESYKQDITERIKTFYDAVDWCDEHSYDVYTSAYTVCVDETINYDDRVKDIISYLKLRIITVALNEGWKPSLNDPRYYACLIKDKSDWLVDSELTSFRTPVQLCFKSHKLAAYAAKQFGDLYADFFGCKKESDK